jgi:predicted SAM-dependent methyltransferase
MTSQANEMTWEMAMATVPVRLYAGDIPPMVQYQGLVGLSEHRADERHIKHDVRRAFPIPSDSVDIFQSEDVFEHILLSELPSIFTEIWRVLKMGGLFRLSIPDYRCDMLVARSLKDAAGRLVFDPGGGGTPEKPGHVWFPVYETVHGLVSNSHFAQGYVNFLHYYAPSGQPVLNQIDYRFGMIKRTPDHDPRVQNPRRPMSLVVDLIKSRALLG